jgi:hypothetical protein
MHRHIEGDLLELYAERRRDRSKFYADLRYFIDILFLFRPGIIRPAEPSKPTNTMSMYKNYLTVGWRSLLKSKVFSVINISGLSLGLTCSIFIALWVNDEYQKNAYHDDIDRLYTVTSVEYSGTDVTGSYDTPGMLAEELKKVMPEVEYATNRGWNEWNTFAVGDKKLKIPGAFVSPDFFKMFSYPLIIGTKETVLKAADNVVISRSLANRLFGSPEAAMDKGVRFENYRDLKVTGVFEDIGDNGQVPILNFTRMPMPMLWPKNFSTSSKHTTKSIQLSIVLNSGFNHFAKPISTAVSAMDIFQEVK